MTEIICKNTFVSESGYAHVAGEHITPYEFKRLTVTERSYFSQGDNLDLSLRDKELDYEGQDPDYY